MQFLLTINGDEAWAAGTPPSEQEMAEMGAFIEDVARSGKLIATGGLEPSTTRVTSVGGEITVTDGPFTEAKEMIAGFALVNVASKEEALDISKRFWQIIGDGEGEMRRVFGPED